MKGNVGLWIDHRKAVIVGLTDPVDGIRRIISHMEKRVRFAGGAADAMTEDQRDRRFAAHLRVYYDRVLSYLREADSILILGPGEAKLELETCLQNASLGGRIAGVETVDKMTDRQITAKVREHFFTAAEDIRQRTT
jgi:hypothetical protein